MSTSIKLLASQAALKKMLSEGYFSISTLDRIIEMMGVKPDREAYQILHTLHCVHYNQMPGDLLEELPTLIHRVLSSPAFDSSRLNVVINGKSLTLVKS